MRIQPLLVGLREIEAAYPIDYTKKKSNYRFFGLPVERDFQPERRSTIYVFKKV